VQLLRVSRRSGGAGAGAWRYEVCPEGVAALERHGSRRIAVVAVCGLYRTGKSFLLNVLLERVKKGLPPFKVGSTTRACTEGLWLWGSVDGEDEQSPLLAFIDCEGFGSTESDRSRDAQLMTLCALLSSVLVLNTKGALNEGLFNALALTCKFAEHIEERGREASRPALLWVLRDFALELRDPSGCPITPDEYLENALRAAPAAGGDAGRSQGARDVRQSLLQFFSQRGCATLVQPAIEEAQLQQLEALPYTSLRSEFRAGVEALRAQLVATCNAHPKTVAGQPLSCFAFAGLMSRLVGALNESRALNVKGAWDAVQHGACGELADELRNSAARTLRTLAAGQPIPGGAQLPMTDEALWAVLRDQRHVLKAQWDGRAVGEEAVRKEYWQELKETLAREQQSVRQNNSRIADQQLLEALTRWQEWLDDDDGDAAAGEQLSRELGQRMERMPTAPLSRALRTAIEAAARRVAASRTAVAAAVERSSEAQQRAIAWGEQAAQQEGAARSELGATHAEVQEAQESLRRMQSAERAAAMELQSRVAELSDAKGQLSELLRDAEDARAREAELRAQHRASSEREVSLRAELEDARATASRTVGERAASEQSARAASEAANAEVRRLEAELQALREEVDRSKDQLASERAVLKSENERVRTEHAQKVEDVRRQLDSERSTLQSEHERTAAEHSRMVEEARKQLDEERRRNQEAISDHQNRLLERERDAGVLEGQVTTLNAERSSLRDRITEQQVCLREAEVKAGRQKQENERLKADAERAEESLQRIRAETAEKLQEQKEEFERRLNEERLKKKQSKAGCFRAKGASVPTKV